MKKLFVLIAVALLVAMVGIAKADYIADPNDPAVLHIGNPPNTGTYLYGDEVRPISDTTLGILENGNSTPLIDSLLLILGVPNKTNATFTAPAITLSNGQAGNIGGTNVFSGTWNVTTGYAGNFTAASTANDVYQFIGLVPYGNASNHFENWHNADLAANGIDASGFGIFVYELHNTPLSGGSVTVTFANAIDNGTFAVAYGADALPTWVPPVAATRHHAAVAGHYDYSHVKSYTTPFTESGLTNHKVPEPGSLLLFGSGLLGLGFFGRKKFRK